MQNIILRSNLRASLVVFLVALPLCLGIALASGAPAFAGIWAGVVGGIVVGALSGSALSVSGPAAGLTVLVLDGIKTSGNFPAFLAAVVLCGVFQLLFGLLKAGVLAHYFPSSVIKGMLAAIGLILIFKQIPHALGYDFDYPGDEDFSEPQGHNTFSDMYYAFLELRPIALLISMVGLTAMWWWDSRKHLFFKTIPGALIAVVLGILIHKLSVLYAPASALESTHLVNLPTGILKGNVGELFVFPDWSYLWHPTTLKIALTLAVIASLESLLSIEAIDRLDPEHRNTPMNRELLAQGAGNVVSGLLGGIPVTAVVVRSSANLIAGAQSKASAVLHGLWIALAVLVFPGIMNQIPLAALASILLLVGYKLTKPALFVDQWNKGFDQFIPFVVSVTAILFTNLLTGIAIGLAVGLLYILRSNLRKSVVMVQDGSNYLIRLRHNVSFINKSTLRQCLRAVKPGSFVIIDGTSAVFIDHDIIETIEEFRLAAMHQNIEAEIKKNASSIHPYFRAH